MRQSGLAALDAAAPRPLAEPSWFDAYVLEGPWPLALALAGVGVLVYAWAASRGRNASGAKWLIGGVAAGAAVALAGALVRTPAEAMRGMSRSLVESVSNADVATATALLAPDAVLVLSDATRREPLERIIERVGRQFGKGGEYEVRDCRVVELQATARGGAGGVVQMKVRATPAGAGFPLASWWRLDLTVDGSGVWRIEGIELISIGGGVTLR
ncbi:MAG: hypothetical protein ACOYPS_05595 [Phycisphaerales bacterium]|jgi:hypothetical protein